MERSLGFNTPISFTSPLHRIKWDRVILDEAHAIKVIGTDSHCRYRIQYLHYFLIISQLITFNIEHMQNRNGSTAKAVFALQYTHQWSVTGTPLQNNVGELYSQVRFLRAGACIVVTD